ncbi:MAG: AEC family transporter [Betaproteobacteria bacterium]|nr:AEC family transporter [Betaproteobacteria bacterium]
MAEALLLLPDFLLILSGFLLCRYTPLGRSLWEGVERLVYFVLFPVLLFTTIARSPLDLASDLPLMGAGLSVTLLGAALALSLGLFPGVARAHHAAGAQAGFRFNSFVALALADRLGGPAGVASMALIIAVTVPVANVAAVWPMARHGEQGLWKELVRNPLIVATVSGLFANAVGLQLPDVLQVTGQRMGAAALALGLMAVGAGLRLGALGDAPRLAAALLTIRHGLLPAFALLVVLAWVPLPPAQQAVLIAFAAMPTASSAYVLAVRMGSEAAYVAGLVTVSTGLAMLGMPLWLMALRAQA